MVIRRNILFERVGTTALEYGNTMYEYDNWRGKRGNVIGRHTCIYLYLYTYTNIHILIYIYIYLYTYTYIPSFCCPSGIWISHLHIHIYIYIFIDTRYLNIYQYTSATFISRYISVENSLLLLQTYRPNDRPSLRIIILYIKQHCISVAVVWNILMFRGHIASAVVVVVFMPTIIALILALSL